jgi:16S rRNA processing protein RimM
MSSRRRRIAARRKQGRSGSPEFGEPEFLVIGHLHRPHGVRGELLMGVMTDFPERIKAGVSVYLGEDHQPGTVASVRHHNKGMLIKFVEYPTIEDIQFIRNWPVFVRADDRPALPEGEFYYHQLIGLQVVTDTEVKLGVIADILETGANSVFIVRTESGDELLLPDIPEVVLQVDVEAKEMRVHVLPGLLPGEE